HQGDRIAHQGVAVDAYRGVGGQRLDEQRHPQLSGGLEVRVLAENGEVGVEDVLESEDLLGEALVLAQEELSRAAAGVVEPEELEQAGHGDVGARVLAEALEQVED